MVIDIKNGTELNIRKEKVSSEIMMVDGFTVGARQEVVIRDRQSLAEDGMFVIIATINGKTGQLRNYETSSLAALYIFVRTNNSYLKHGFLLRRLIEKVQQSHTLSTLIS